MRTQLLASSSERGKSVIWENEVWQLEKSIATNVRKYTRTHGVRAKRSYSEEYLVTPSKESFWCLCILSRLLHTEKV